MRDLALEQWLVIYQVLLQQRGEIARYARLEPLLADIEDAIALIVAATGHVPVAPSPDALRQEVAAAIADATEKHRFVYRLLQAYAEYGPAAERGPVGAALAALYPEGLTILNQDWSTRAGAAEGFAQRAASPVVRAGLASVFAFAPALADYLEAAVVAGRRLAAAVTALEATNAARAASAQEARPAPSGRVALAECRALWNDFSTTLRRVTRANRPEDLALRATLLATYEKEVANSRRGRDAEDDADEAPAPATPEVPVPV